MGRKRIIILQTSHILTDQRMQKMSKSLSKDYNVEILYRNYLKNKAQLNEVFKIENTQLNYIKTLFNSGFLFYFEFNIRLIWKSIFKKIDIIYSVDSDTLLAAIFLKIIRRKPLIYDAHEYFEEVPELEDFPIKKLIWNKITTLGLKFSNLNITVSHSLQKEFAQKFNKEFSLVRNIPEYYEINEKIEKFERPTLVYQGALNKGRQLELLINTMLKLPQFDCLIIGEGDLTNSLKKMANHSPNIKFLGILSPLELKKITPKCHLGFNMLESIGKSYQMSLSNKYFDYLHAGIPSVSSYMAEYQHLNNNYNIGICISESDLEEKLLNLLSFNEEYKEMLENIKKVKAELTWKNEFESIRLKISEFKN